MRKVITAGFLIFMLLCVVISGAAIGLLSKIDDLTLDSD